MEAQKESAEKISGYSLYKTSTVFATIVIPIELIIGIVVYKYILGNPAHFMDNNPANHPLPGDFWGMVYKGGVTVPVIITFFLVVLTFFIERIWTLYKARGNNNPVEFVLNIKKHVSSFDIDEAKKACDEQQGSIANVVKAGLERYEDIRNRKDLTLEQKTLALQKEMDEASEMEIPVLEKNIIILSTIASIATLTGLLGTVLGMIKAFAALAHAGAPDAVGLATGISEALMSTALGISTSMIAILLYNYVTTRIDKIMFLTAEISQAIIRTFSYKHIDE